MQRQWPTPNNNELKEQIRKADKITLALRCRNYKFILKEFGPPAHMLIIGGAPAMFAINELRISFINGQYMAAILLAQSFIEHTLGGYFIMSGDDKIAEAGFAKLIRESIRIKQINKRLALKLHKLREMRNPYTHPKACYDSHSHFRRMEAERIYLPEKLVKNDAKLAIKIVVDFLRFRSPHWQPE